MVVIGENGENIYGMKPELQDWAYAQNELFDQQKALQERGQWLEAEERLSLELLASEGITGDELIARYAGIISRYSDSRRLFQLEEMLKLQPRLLTGESIMPTASVLEIDTIMPPEDDEVEAQPWINDESHTLVWRVQTVKYPAGITVKKDTLVGHDDIMQRLAMPTDSLKAAGVDKLGAMAAMYEAIGEFAIGQDYRNKAANLASVHLLNAKDAFVPDLAKDLMALERAATEKFEDFLCRLAINIAEDDYSRKYYGTNLKQLEAVVYLGKLRNGVQVGVDSYVVDQAEVLGFYREFKVRGDRLLVAQANQEQ